MIGVLFCFKGFKCVQYWRAIKYFDFGATQWGTIDIGCIRFFVSWVSGPCQGRRPPWEASWVAKAHPAHLKAHVPPTESHHSLDRRIWCTSPRSVVSGLKQFSVQWDRKNRDDQSGREDCADCTTVANVMQLCISKYATQCPDDQSWEGCKIMKFIIWTWARGIDFIFLNMISHGTGVSTVGLRGYKAKQMLITQGQFLPLNKDNTCKRFLVNTGAPCSP